MANALVNSPAKFVVSPKDSLEISPDDHHDTKFKVTPAVNITNSHIRNTGILGKEFITESREINSESSSIQDGHLQCRNSTDLAILTKAVSIDRSSKRKSTIPAGKNPVSDLLLLAPSVTKLDRKISTKGNTSFFRHSLPDFSMTEYYYSSLNMHTSFHHQPKKKLLANIKKINKSTADLLSMKKAALAKDQLIPDKNNEPPGLPVPDIERNAGHSLSTNFMPIEEEYTSPLFPEDQSQPLDLQNNFSRLDLTEDQNEAHSLEQRRSIKRLNTIKELMDTEDTYSKDLGILCNHFFDVIKSFPSITDKQKDIIIRNGMEIFAFQEKFSDALLEAHGSEEEIKNGVVYRGNLKNIAKCFVEWGPKFEIYLDYCIRQDQAVSTYTELLQDNDEFAKLIERLHTFYRVSFGFSKLKFDDYLIIPVQRIFRYKLLLQSITKATQKDTEEYELLHQAQDIIHTIATKINNEKSKMEAQKKTSLFLSRLNPDWCLQSRWFSALGVCSLIGTLEVRVDGDSKPRRVGCALFCHYIIMAKGKKHDQYEPKYWFPLRKFELENLNGYEGQMTYSWLLRDEEHTLELGAICDTEKQLWIDMLSKSIKESKERYANSVDSNEYLLEQLFVSSFDQNAHQKPITNAEPVVDTPIQLPMPNGSVSFSQSLIFNNKSNKSNNRASHPIYSTKDYTTVETTFTSNGPKSPALRCQSSISDLKDYFSINNVTEKWNQRKVNQNHSRIKSVDTKFEDVCTTPILTARANSMKRASVKGSWIQPSLSVATNKTPTDGTDVILNSFTFNLPSANISETCSSNQSSRRPSMNQSKPSLVRRPSSIKRHSSIKSLIYKHGNQLATDMAGSATDLPTSSSSSSFSRRSSRFFGKMVEKLGHIGTPSRTRRGHMTPNSSAATLFSKPPTLQNSGSCFISKKEIETVRTVKSKKKFFNSLLSHCQNKKDK